MSAEFNAGEDNGFDGLPQPEATPEPEPTPPEPSPPPAPAPAPMVGYERRDRSGPDALSLPFLSLPDLGPALAETTSSDVTTTSTGEDRVNVRFNPKQDNK